MAIYIQATSFDEVFLLVAFDGYCCNLHVLFLIAVSKLSTS